jgi:hypothetical protein
MPVLDAPTRAGAREASARRKLWSYLTISALATLEPVPVFRARKLAPVQSFTYSARHFSAVKERKSLNAASVSRCTNLRGTAQPHRYDNERSGVTCLQHDGGAGVPTALTDTVSGLAGRVTCFCDTRRFSSILQALTHRLPALYMLDKPGPDAHDAGRTALRPPAVGP